MREIFVNFFKVRDYWIAFGYDFLRKKVVLTFMPQKNKEVLLKQVKRLSKKLDKKDLKIRISDSVENPNLLRIAEALMDIYEGKREDVIIEYEYPYEVTNFAKNVYEETAKIPKGFVSSYSDIAMRAGKPKAFRAAGNILAENLLCLVVPCHRIVKKSGELGGFGGKEKNQMLKRMLLEKEGVKISEKGVVQKESFFKS
ncbi:MAG: methylated-DNA--[protein]-cysteine S-methyltransferase [Candidatus Hodarchaeota archaeon]